MFSFLKRKSNNEEQQKQVYPEINDLLSFNPTSEEQANLRSNFLSLYKNKLDDNIKFFQDEQKTNYSKYKHYKTIGGSNKENDIKCYKKILKKDDKKFLLFVGVAEYHHLKPETIIEYLYTLKCQERAIWDKLLLEFYAIKIYDSEKQKGYLRYKSPVRYLFADRDVCAIRDIVKNENDEWLHSIISVEEDVGIKKNTVRMEIVRCCWHLKYDEKRDLTHVTYLSAIDCKVTVFPTWLIALTLGSQPDSVLHLRDHIEKMEKEKKENEGKIE